MMRISYLVQSSIDEDHCFLSTNKVFVLLSISLLQLLSYTLHKLTSLVWISILGKLAFPLFEFPINCLLEFATALCLLSNLDTLLLLFLWNWEFLLSWKLFLFVLKLNSLTTVWVGAWFTVPLLFRLIIIYTFCSYF